VLLLVSIVLVFGTLGVFVGNVIVSQQGELGFGFQQMIHARIPWLLLAPPLIGAALGVFSLVRARRWYKWLIVPVEVVFAGLMTWYFTSFSFLPEHQLALSVGEPFPSYSLVDQDSTVHAVESGTDRRPALYIFYRGDW
jgi:hypothetical protein